MWANLTVNLLDEERKDWRLGVGATAHSRSQQDEKGAKEGRSLGEVGGRDVRGDKAFKLLRLKTIFPGEAYYEHFLQFLPLNTVYCIHSSIHPFDRY